VTTLEAHPDVVALHTSADWFGDPRHEVLIGEASDLLPKLVAGGSYDGYVLDHWETVGDKLAEKVAFLRLLEDAGQGDRAVSMWGFWWEVERTASSDDPDTAVLLAEVTRCVECGRILAREGDPTDSFSVPGAGGGRCVNCFERATLQVTTG
jgi:hypothetical protein